MGADFLISTLTIEEGGQPNWAAGRQQLAAMSDEQLAKLADDVMFDSDLDAGGVRQRIAEAIDQVEQAITEGSREMEIIEVPGWTIYLTGGLSWGYEPTELFAVFGRLWEGGIATAIGFV